MGIIKKRLMAVAFFVDKKGLKDQIESTGEAIESEFQKLEEKIEALNVFWLASFAKTLNKIESRIKALEEIHPFSLQDHRHTEKDPLPTDRHGNPPGGLKKWDVISYTALENKEKIVGEFHKGNRGEIWGYFHNWGSKPEGELYMVGADRVTFEFRPKPEKS